MIDFEQEIEQRLREFMLLTGKGNVKDSNRSLYEIIRLMLGMIARNHRRGASGEDRIDTAPALPSDLINQRPSGPPIEGEHIAISSASLMHPDAASYSPGLVEARPGEAASTAVKLNAPYGLTKFGNPRRLRKR